MSNPTRRMQLLGDFLRGIEIAAIPTAYKGYTFRSRLELRFAFHLDGRGEQWKYEPRIYGPKGRGYLPDFELLGLSRPTFIEVKPTLAEIAGAQSKMSVIWDDNPDALLMVACWQGCTYSAALRGGPWESWQERWAA